MEIDDRYQMYFCKNCGWIAEITEGGDYGDNIPACNDCGRGTSDDNGLVEIEQVEPKTIAIAGIKRFEKNKILLNTAIENLKESFQDAIKEIDK